LSLFPPDTMTRTFTPRRRASLNASTAAPSGTKYGFAIRIDLRAQTIDSRYRMRTADEPSAGELMTV
jgi:hypothetical protein